MKTYDNINLNVHPTEKQVLLGLGGNKIFSQEVTEKLYEKPTNSFLSVQNNHKNPKQLPLLVTIGDVHANLKRILIELILTGRFLLGKNFKESQKKYATLVRLLNSYRDNYHHKKKLTETDRDAILEIFRGVQECLKHLQLVHPNSRTSINFLGDLIGDRGPNDAFIIFFLLQLASLKNVDFTILLSNHDFNWFIVPVMRLFEHLGIDYDNPRFDKLKPNKKQEAFKFFSYEMLATNGEYSLKTYSLQYRSFMNLLITIDAGLFPLEYLHHFYTKVYVPRTAPIKFNFLKDRIQLSSHTLISEETLSLLFTEVGLAHEEKIKIDLEKINRVELKQYESILLKVYQEKLKWGQASTGNLHYFSHTEDIRKTDIIDEESKEILFKSAPAMPLSEAAKGLVIALVHTIPNSIASEEYKNKLNFEKAKALILDSGNQNAFLLPQFAICEPRPKIFYNFQNKFKTYYQDITGEKFIGENIKLNRQTLITSLGKMPVCCIFGHSKIKVPEQYNGRLICLDNPLGKHTLDEKRILDYTVGAPIILSSTTMTTPAKIKFNPIPCYRFDKFQIFQIIENTLSTVSTEEQGLSKTISGKGRRSSAFSLFDSNKPEKVKFLKALLKALKEEKDLSEFPETIGQLAKKYKNAFKKRGFGKCRTKEATEKMKAIVKHFCPGEEQQKKRNDIIL